MNLCSDQWVLEFAAPERIAAVTWLARDPRMSFHAARAAAVPVNHGRTEELLRLQPDLILAGRYTTRATVRLLRQAGIAVEELDVPSTLEEVAAQARRLGALLGAPEAGERFAARIEALPAPAPHPLRVAVLRPGGSAGGRGTLLESLVAAAGHESLSAPGRTRLDLEMLLRERPDAIVTALDGDAPPAEATLWLQHPALRHATLRPPSVLPGSLWICAGPGNPEAVALLAALPSP
nr:ABC transporter substrate-binding protein [uncultured Roseococcus sp.]